MYLRGLATDAFMLCTEYDSTCFMVYGIGFSFHFFILQFYPLQAYSTNEAA